MNQKNILIFTCVIIFILIVFYIGNIRDRFSSDLIYNVKDLSTKGVTWTKRTKRTKRT